MLKNKLIDSNIKESSKEFLPTDVRNGHREFLKKYVFCWPDLRNWHVIRYFTNTTRGTCPRLFPKCSCGADNTPDHGANHCPIVLKNRDEILRQFEGLFESIGVKRKNNLFEYLHAVYFSIDGVQDRTLVRKLVELMKTTILQLIMNDKSQDGRKPEAELDDDELGMSFNLNDTVLADDTE